MSDGRTRIKPTPYRDEQNVIKGSGTGTLETVDASKKAIKYKLAAPDNMIVKEGL